MPEQFLIAIVAFFRALFLSLLEGFLLWLIWEYLLYSLINIAPCNYLWLAGILFIPNLIWSYIKLNKRFE